MDFRLVEIALNYVIIKELKTGKTEKIEKYKKYGNWTLMEIITKDNEEPVAVFENHGDKKGSIVYMSEKAVICKLSKSLELTKMSKESSYWREKLKEVANNPRDFLAEKILAERKDPSYDVVAECFPPIGKPEDRYSGHEIITTFVGSQNCIDKPVIFYGGRSPTFSPIALAPEIGKIIENGQVQEGLVGGWLPVLRFVYPVEKKTFWELLIFGETKPASFWIQPVWYRLVKIMNGTLKRAEYCRSYLHTRNKAKGKVFYEELLKLREKLDNVLKPAMKINLPEARVSNFCRYSLIRAMITWIGDHPKYGVSDRSLFPYDGSEHDGFPDTFTSSTSCLLEWGLFEVAGKYLDNYLTEFVEEDGSIDYRGPETGQYGKMLSIFARYYEYTKDYTLLLKNIEKIRGIENLLLSLREKSKKLPPNDPAYGMISGWSEADSWPSERYNQPYFSNSTEACRGFYDLGNVWLKIGRELSKPELINRGKELVREAEELKRDILASVQKSTISKRDFTYIPPIAGVKKPYDEDIREDPHSPQQYATRAYCEMLESGILPTSVIDAIMKYNSTHGGSVLNIGSIGGGRRAECKVISTFLAHGYAYGLIQSDKIREFLLLYYALMAHCHTRGTWTAFEYQVINRAGKRTFSPYCLPAQLSIPILTKWMLVFEDPNLPVLRLGWAIPRIWLENNKRIVIQDAPTRWGKVSYEVTSRIDEGKIFAVIKIPQPNFDAEVILRLRTPHKRRIKEVFVNNKSWPEFDVDGEIIRLPADLQGQVPIEVKYEES